MHSHHNKLPGWLDRAYTESHISLALQTLAERESQRGRLRSIGVEQYRRRTQRSTTSPESSPGSSPGSSLVDPQRQYHHYSVVEAYHEENIHHNRYFDVVPYNRTRVVAKTGDVEQYLNASWVLERLGHKWWIAAQAPLPTTIHTYLSLLLQPIQNPLKSLPLQPDPQEIAEANALSPGASRIRTIVQLTRNVEGNRTKAHAYFPSEVGKSLIVKPFESGLPISALKVTLLRSQDHKDAQCIQSTVSISPIEDPRQLSSHEDGGPTAEGQSNKRVVFQHLLYTAWPDHGVPEDGDRASLLAFLKLADQINRDLSLCTYPPESPQPDQQYDPDPPMIVGCSAGIGRTGSFVALSSLLRHIGLLPPAANPTPASVIPPSPLGPLPEQLVGDLVVEEIDTLREQRPRMVERQEQTLLIYELLMKNAF